VKTTPSTRKLAAAVLLLVLAAAATIAQSIAVIAPGEDGKASRLASALRSELESAGTSVPDPDLARAAFSSVPVDDPFNLTTADAMNIGSSVGTRFFVLLKPVFQRRSTFERHEFYEASATVYLVSSVTGELAYWTLDKFEEDDPGTAGERLLTSMPDLAARLIDLAKKAADAELKEGKAEGFPVYPPDEKDLRPPLPYRRIKPEYTLLADYYGVAATVDIEADIDADGRVVKTKIVRWAGYGLDESVERTVREMQWRPADRKGKTLPMRILLRYNFRDLKDDEN